MMIAECPECHSPLTLNDVGEVVCTNCGLVVSDFVPERRRASQRRVMPWRLPVEVHSTGSLLTVSLRIAEGLGPEGVSRYRRLAKAHKLSPVYGDRSTLYRAIKVLERVCNELRIPEDVRERAVQVYHKMLKVLPDGVVRPNHYRLVAASLIVALKEAELTVPIRDVISCFRKLGHRVSYSGVLRAHFHIRKLIGYNPRVNLRAYVYGVLESLIPGRSLSDDEFRLRVYRRAMLLLSNVERRQVAGKNPYIVALAAVYAAAVLVSGKRRPRAITQRALSEASGFSESAIRACYRAVFKSLVEC